MIPVISFVGSSSSGKTTLIEKLVDYISKMGYKVGTIKHTHHNIEIDQKGKDSYRHFHSGAVSSMIISPEKVGYISKIFPEDITSLVEKFFGHCDLVIIEGFKNDETKKIEVYRSSTKQKPLYKSLKNVVAIATDTGFKDIACLNINDLEKITELVLKVSGITKKTLNQKDVNSIKL